MPEDQVEFISIKGEPVDFSKGQKKKKQPTKPNKTTELNLAEYAEQLQQVSLEILNLKRCIAEIAHYSGTQRVLKNYGIEPYEIKPDDMRKFKS